MPNSNSSIAKVGTQLLRIKDYYAMRQFSHILIMDVPHGFHILKKNLKLNLRKAQNKCIRFYLNLRPRTHIDPSHFKKNCG